MNDPLSPTFESIQEAVKREFLESCSFAYLLGSAATERFTKDSDIDIAIYITDWSAIKKSSSTFRLDRSSNLEKVLGFSVDLIILNSTDPIFARQVIANGRQLFVNKQSDDFLIWKSRQLSIYPDFKTSREIIEKNLLAKKKNN